MCEEGGGKDDRVDARGRGSTASARGSRRKRRMDSALRFQISEYGAEINAADARARACASQRDRAIYIYIYI